MRSPMARIWQWIKHNKLWALLWTIVSFVLLAIVGEVIGNVGYDILRPYFPLLTIVVSGPLWLILGFDIIVVFFLTIPLAYYAWTFKRKSNLSSQLNELDITLHRLLGRLGKAPMDEVIERIMCDFLEEILELFKLYDDGYRISVFVPDDQNPEYLVMKYAANMPADTISRTKFYIGPESDPEKPRGIAGRTYLDGEIRHVQFNRQKNGYWVADTPGYKTFVQGKQPSYRSFVTIPINLDSENRRFGVLCLDSKHKDACSDEQSQSILLDIGTKIATVIHLSQELR